MESLFPLVFMMMIIAFVGYHIVKGMIDGYSGANQPKMICQNCGTIGEPSIKTKGSIAIEIVLWLCFIVPGIIYSVWRLSNKYQACPACGSNNMIGTDTPRGKQLMQQFSAK